MRGYNTDDNMNGSINNAKLFDRNFQNINNRKNQNSNIDRLFAERDFDKGNSYDSDDENNVGEITGNTMKGDGINKGMPMRSQYNSRKAAYDANKYLDFNLYDKKPSKTKVGYNDENNYSAFADINSSMTPITQQANPDYILSNGLENFGSRLFKSMFNLLPNNNFIVCTHGLYSLFASLYLISNGNTEHESKKFFNFPDKNVILKSLNKMNMDNKIVNIKNFLVMADNITCNMEQLKLIEPYCTICNVNINEPTREAAKLTYIVNKMMNQKMRNPVTPSNIENLQVMLMTTAVIRPIWNAPFDRIEKRIFYGYENDRKQRYLVSHGSSYSYFEDNDHQLIEIKFGSSKTNSSLAFGILLHKNTQATETNEKLHFYIDNMKPTILDEIRIPAFTQDLKFRYNNLLKKMGYQTPFHQITSRNVFPEGRVQLHDIIQNAKIVIDSTSYDGKNNTHGCHTIQKFIADKPFFYYLRSISTNTIFVNGLYQ
jgi:serine protease inhibitor